MVEKEVEVFDITASAAKVRWNMLDGGDGGDSTSVVETFSPRQRKVSPVLSYRKKKKLGQEKDINLW